MKERKVMKLGILLCLASFIGSFSGYYYAVKNIHDEISVKSKMEAPFIKISAEHINNTKTYILKELDGALALYIKSGDSPPVIYKKYDVYVSTLPQIDREALKQGIEIPTLSDALLVAESYLE